MTTLDCRSCGACCTSTQDGVPFTMPITKREAQRLPRNVVGGNLRIPELVGYRRSLRAHPTLNRCAALEGVVGLSCSCRVYDERPRVCRAFPVGSAYCLAARAQMGIRNEVG